MGRPSSSRILSSLLAGALCGAAFFAPAPAHAQDDGAEARAAFDRGVLRFGQRRYEQALEAFREAYSIRSHPAVIFNIASCLDKLGRAVEAVTEYQRYVRLRGAEMEPARQEDVRRALQRLQRRVAFLRIVSPTSDAALELDGEPVELGEDPIVVTPGLHTVAAASSDGRAASTSVEVAPGETAEARLRFGVQGEDLGTGGESSPGEGTGSSDGTSGDGGGPVDRFGRTRPGWNPTLRWVGLGATAVFAAAWLYTGLRAISLNADYEAHPDPDLRDKGLVYRSLADFVFLPCSILAAGFTVLAFVFARKATVTTATGETAFVVPALFPGGAGIMATLDLF